MLLKHGANVNTQNHQGRTPLWRAAFMDKQECLTLTLILTLTMDKQECVKLLLEAGADPRITSADQQTPLQATDPNQSRWNTYY